MLPSLRALNAAASGAAPTHYLITLVRSARGLPPASGATLEALGLHRLHQSVLHPFGPEAAGKILKVKELVTVRNVTEAEGRVAAIRRRPEGSGVVPTGRAPGGLKRDHAVGL
ncbi:39S ribosomal protein L33, mitochondrial [Vanrija albida]|uniref:Large ribosomal subunit protein uL30m n=1 Tax=Vanrija albida TaxID=181172 RepID=A0ABR3PYY8_9TREE